MEFKDITKKENPLLHRTEVSAILCFEGATPSNPDVKKKLGEKVGVDANFCIVKHVYTRFGETCADVLMFAYDSKENMMKIERIKEVKEEKPAEAAKEEPKAEEKPAEAPKEEPKEEAKPTEAKVEEKPAEAPKEESKAEEKPAEEAKPAEAKAEEKPAEEKKE